MKKFSLILAIIMLFASINVFAALPEDTVSPQANCMNHNFSEVIDFDTNTDKHIRRCTNGNCIATMEEECIPTSQFCGDSNSNDCFSCVICDNNTIDANHNYQYVHYVDYSTSPGTHKHVQTCNNLNPYGIAIPCGREVESSRCDCSNVRQIWTTYTLHYGHRVEDRCPTCGYEHHFVGYYGIIEDHENGYDPTCDICLCYQDYIDF